MDWHYVRGTSPAAAAAVDRKREATTGSNNMCVVESRPKVATIDTSKRNERHVHKTQSISWRNLGGLMNSIIILDTSILSMLSLSIYDILLHYFQMMMMIILS